VAHVRQVGDDEATGLLKRIYGEAIARAGKVWGILRVQSLNPAALEAGMGMYKTIMFGPSPLSRARREMLATVVSRANDCFY
jgi:alkylhydroperoxidase family enzyme